jgi:hypothetical protein
MRRSRLGVLFAHHFFSLMNLLDKNRIFEA